MITLHCAPRLLLLSAVSLAVSTAPAERADLQHDAVSRLAIIQGRTRVPGLHYEVRVQRDKWGVPHIYARDQHDLFFAQGYVVAQDRLFQMELWKRAGQGRLAEVLGPSAVARDINARRLRFRGDWAQEYASYAPDAANILEAFTAGINAYIATIRNGKRPGLPLEFTLTGFSPEPWKPEDCVNRLAAYSMMGNAKQELLHAELVSRIGADNAATLLRLDPRVPLDPAPGADFSGLSPALLQDVVSSDARIPFPASDLRESNNWTLSGALTATGKPLLANDPHRVIGEPSLRYIVHLSAPGWNVIGAGEPGLPGVADGHNADIAWGFTIFGLDQEDLYLEALNPRDPKQYRTPIGWAPVQEVQEVIHVRGAPDKQVTLRFTAHGPLMWEDGTRALALRWVGMEFGTAGYLGSLTLDRARGWQDFERAMPRWKVPSENIVFADRAGNIGEHSTGLAPLRKNFTGLLPLPTNGQFEWAGFIPNSELPHSYNPARGFIASANQKMIPDGYPYAVGFEWAPPARFNRIEEVLGEAARASRKLTVADSQALQADVVSLPARKLQALLRQALAATGGESRAAATPGAELLLNWDAALRADSAAAALYELWITELRNTVTHRAVPASVQDAIKLLPADAVIEELSVRRPAVFKTSGPGSRDAVLLESLRTAYAKLAGLQGADPSKWRWGALHLAYFRHALDALPGSSAVLDRGPVERSGDGEVVQATGGRDGSFEQASGASYRQVFDLSDWDNSVAVNVPGQSGQPASRHYDDLVPLWSTGRYFPLKFTRAAVDAVTTDTLILEP